MVAHVIAVHEEVPFGQMEIDTIDTHSLEEGTSKEDYKCGSLAVRVDQEAPRLLFSPLDITEMLLLRCALLVDIKLRFGPRLLRCFRLLFESRQDIIRAHIVTLFHFVAHDHLSKFLEQCVSARATVQPLFPAANRRVPPSSDR